MILRALPLMLIVIPVIGFFYTPEPPPDSMNSDGRQMIANLAYFLFTIPWWGKLMSIFVGLAWIMGNSEDKTEND